MPSIPDIEVGNIGEVSIEPVHTWIDVQPVVSAISPPITLGLGTPIIQIPGCVEAHPASGKSNKIDTDDPRGVRTYCDASQPTFTPLDYTPENLIYQKPAKFSGYRQSSPNKKSNEEDAEEEDVTAGNTALPVTPAPKPISLPAGEKNEEKEDTVTCAEGYQLVERECIEVVAEVKAEVSFVEKYLPTLPQTTTTATIAVVATTSALMAKPFADLLLKLVKPTVKKVVKKIASLRGRPQKVESVLHRRLAQRDRNRAIRALRLALKK